MSIKDSAYAAAKVVKGLPERTTVCQVLRSLDEVGHPGSVSDRSQLGYFARRTHAQFLGYLLVDQERDKVSELPVPIPPLQSDERSLLHRCHMTMLEIIKMAAGGLPQQFFQAANPYSVFNRLQGTSSEMLQVSSTVLDCFTDSLNSHRALQVISEANIDPNRVDAEAVHKGVLAIVSEIRKAGIDQFPENLRSTLFLPRDSDASRVASVLSQ